MRQEHPPKNRLLAYQQRSLRHSKHEDVQEFNRPYSSYDNSITGISFLERLPRLPYRKMTALLIGATAIFLIFLLVSEENVKSNVKSPVKPVSAKILIPTISLPEPENVVRATVVHEVKSGETLGTIFQKYGLSWNDATQVHASLHELSRTEEFHASIRPRQKLEFELDDEGNLQALSSQLRANLGVTIERTEEGAFSGRVDRIVGTIAEQHVVGEVSSELNSFSAAARQAGLSYATIDEFVDLFSNRVGFRRDLRAGDTFIVVYEDERLDNGSVIRTGPIKAAAITLRGERYAAIRHETKDGKAYYFDEAGQSLENVFLRYPLKFSRISSVYTHARFHPVLKRNRPHLGVDFAAPTGTPIRSVAHGRVLFAGPKGPNGNFIRIQHSDTYETAYLHLSRIEKGVTRGALVKRGQLIGRVGTTGLSTGPHLCFRLRKNGKYIDPLNSKLPSIDDLDPSVRPEKEYIASILERLDSLKATML